MQIQISHVDLLRPNRRKCAAFRSPLFCWERLVDRLLKRSDWHYKIGGLADSFLECSLPGALKAFREGRVVTFRNDFLLEYLIIERFEMNWPESALIYWHGNVAQDSNFLPDVGPSILILHHPRSEDISRDPGSTLHCKVCEL